jgi:hypothetical protein
MIPRVPLREALLDPNLLGAAIGGDSWRSWRTLLIAVMGEELREDERGIFSQLTGREHEPLQRVDQFAAVIGRNYSFLSVPNVYEWLISRYLNHQQPTVTGGTYPLYIRSEGLWHGPSPIAIWGAAPPATG